MDVGKHLLQVIPQRVPQKQQASSQNKNHSEHIQHNRQDMELFFSNDAAVLWVLRVIREPNALVNLVRAWIGIFGINALDQLPVRKKFKDRCLPVTESGLCVAFPLNGYDIYHFCLCVSGKWPFRSIQGIKNHPGNLRNQAENNQDNPADPQSVPHQNTPFRIKYPVPSVPSVLLRK